MIISFYSLAITLTTVGLQDIGQCALWSAGADERLVEKEFLDIKTGKTGSDSFEKKLARRFNGESVRFGDSNALPEFCPLKVSDKKVDLVSYTGMIRIAELVVGKSSQYFTLYACGTSIAPEKPSDSRLGAENYRVSMITDGYSEAAGIVMRFAGKFPTFMPSATITEGGVFDSGGTDEGVMLFRTVFPQESWLTHVLGRTFVTLSQSISQISVS